MWPMISGANLTSPRTEVPLGTDAVEANLQAYYNGTAVQGIISPPWKLLIGAIGNNIWQGPQCVPLPRARSASLLHLLVARSSLRSQLAKVLAALAQVHAVLAQVTASGQTGRRTP